MKIAFKTLAPLKKEAKQLRKSLKSIQVDLKLQGCQDIVANFYGWEGYNPMSLAHVKFNENAFSVLKDMEERLGSDSIFDQVGNVIDIETGALTFGSDWSIQCRIINSLNLIERRQLEINKKNIIRDIVSKHTQSPEAVKKVIDEVLNSRSVIEKIKESFISNKEISSLSHFDKNIFNNHVSIFGGSTEQRAKIYAGQALEDATEYGGYFVLSKSVMERMYPLLSSSLKGSKIQLEIVDTTMNPMSPTYKESIAFDALYCQGHEPFSCLMANYGKDNSELNDMWYGRATVLMRAIERALVIELANDPMFLSKRWRKKDGLFDKFKNNEIDAFYKMFAKELFEILQISIESESKSDIKQNDKLYNHLDEFLKNSVAYDIYINDREDDRFEIQVGCLGHMVFEAISFYDLGLENKELRIAERVRFGEVLSIVVFDEEIVTTRTMLPHLQRYRNSLVPLLGVRLEFDSNDIVHSKPQKTSRTSVVLDHYDKYPGNGMAVVSAQARTLGIRTWYSIDSPNSGNNSFIRSEDEQASVIANTMLRIYLSVSSFNDSLMAAVKEYEIEQESNGTIIRTSTGYSDVGMDLLEIKRKYRALLDVDYIEIIDSMVVHVVGANEVKILRND